MLIFHLRKVLWPHLYPPNQEKPTSEASKANKVENAEAERDSDVDDLLADIPPATPQAAAGSVSATATTRAASTTTALSTVQLETIKEARKLFSDEVTRTHEGSGFAISFVEKLYNLGFNGFNFRPDAYRKGEDEVISKLSQDNMEAYNLASNVLKEKAIDKAARDQQAAAAEARRVAAANETERARVAREETARAAAAAEAQRTAAANEVERARASREEAARAAAAAANKNKPAQSPHTASHHQASTAHTVLQTATTSQLTSTDKVTPPPSLLVRLVRDAITHYNDKHSGPKIGWNVALSNDNSVIITDTTGKKTIAEIEKSEKSTSYKFKEPLNQQSAYIALHSSNSPATLDSNSLADMREFKKAQEDLRKNGVDKVINLSDAAVLFVQEKIKKGEATAEEFKDFLPSAAPTLDPNRASSSNQPK